MSPPHKTHFLKRHATKLIASAVITACLVYALQSGGLKVWPTGVSFERVQWWALVPYTATVIVMNYYRAVRWRFLLRAVVDIPKRRILGVSWIGFAAILILPFRIGEFVRPYMLHSPGNGQGGKTGKGAPEVSISMATGSVVAERVTDLLYVSIVLAIALLAIPTIQPLPDTVVNLKVSVAWVRRAGFLMLGLSIVAFSVITVFYLARGWAHRTTLLVFGKISRPLGEKLAGIAERLADGLHFLGRPQDAVPFLWETTIYWGLNIGGMWLLARFSGIVHADGSPPTIGEACALMGMLSCAILLPGPPGLLGVFQAGLYAGMTMYYPTEIITGPGVAYVFLVYGIQVAWTLVAAAIFLLIDRGSLRALEDAEASREEEEDEDHAPGAAAGTGEGAGAGAPGPQV